MKTAILAAVSREFGVTPQDLTGTRGVKRITLARSAAYYIARHGYGWSWHDIARQFGRESHTTPIKVMPRFTRRLRWDDVTRGRVERILRELRRNPSIEDFTTEVSCGSAWLTILVGAYRQMQEEKKAA